MSHIFICQMWELCFQEWPCWPSNIIYLHVGHGELNFRQSVELRNVNKIQIGVLFTLEDENWTIAAYLSKRILKAFVLIHCLNFALKQSWVQMKESLEDWKKTPSMACFKSSRKTFQAWSHWRPPNPLKFVLAVELLQSNTAMGCQ